MAASSNDGVAVSLYDWAQSSNNPMVAAVTKAIYYSGNIIQDIKFITDARMQVAWARMIGGLPVPTSARIGDPPTSQHFTPDRLLEQAYMFRDNIDTDSVQMRDKNTIGGPGKIRAIQTQAYLEGFKYRFNDLFFNNTAGRAAAGSFGGFISDSKMPVGIRYKLDLTATTNDYKLVAANLINAGGNDMSPSGMTTATANRYVELLEQALYQTGSAEGDGCSIYMPALLIRRTATALRQLGVSGWGFQKDVYEQSFMHYKNAKIVDCGLKAPAVDGTQTYSIIPTNETSAGADGSNGNDAYTSLYVVRHGDDQFCGWQFAELNAEDLGRMNDGVFYRTFFEFVFGLAAVAPRCIVRVYGNKIA